MKKTDNYQLSQWDPTDRVMRQDSNADNLNIETALAGLNAAKLGRPELLEDCSEDNVASAIARSIYIDWTEWDFFAVHLDLPDGPVPGDTLRCQLPKKTVIYRAETAPALLLFRPGHDPDKRIRTLVLSRPVTDLVTLDLTYRDLQ